jgi:hypothetical protein
VWARVSGLVSARASVLVSVLMSGPGLALVSVQVLVPA